MDATFLKDWSKEDDIKFLDLVSVYGTHNWKSIAEQFESKSAKQLRQRWHNHLNPDIKKGVWTIEEDKLILSCQAKHGNAWAKIAKIITGRTDNQIKNRYYSITRQPMFQKRYRSDESVASVYTGQAMANIIGNISSRSASQNQSININSISTIKDPTIDTNNQLINHPVLPTELVSVSSSTPSVSRASIDVTDNDTVSEYNEYECNNGNHHNRSRESVLIPVTVAKPMKIRRLEEVQQQLQQSLSAVTYSSHYSLPQPQPQGVDFIQTTDWSFLLEEKILPTPRIGENSNEEEEEVVYDFNHHHHNANNHITNSNNSSSSVIKSESSFLQKAHHHCHHHLFSHDAIIQQQQACLDDVNSILSRIQPLDTSSYVQSNLHIHNKLNIHNNSNNSSSKPRHSLLDLDLSQLGTLVETSTFAVVNGLHSARLSARTTSATASNAEINSPPSAIITPAITTATSATNDIYTPATLTTTAPLASAVSSSISNISSSLKPVPGHPYLFYDVSHPMFLQHLQQSSNITASTTTPTQTDTASTTAEAAEVIAIIDITAIAPVVIAQVEEIKTMRMLENAFYQQSLSLKMYVQN